MYEVLVPRRFVVLMFTFRALHISTLRTLDKAAPPTDTEKLLNLPSEVMRNSSTVIFHCHATWPQQQRNRTAQQMSFS